MRQDKFITILIITLLALFCINANAQEKKLSLLGVTFHGFEVSKKSAETMTNKLTSNGFIALNPQINVSFYQNQVISNFSFVIDCYAHPAIYLGKGKIYQVEENLKLGYMFGLYIRQYPGDGEVDLMVHGNYQFIPSPSLLAEYSLNKRLSIRVNSNIVINFVDLAFSF